MAREVPAIWRLMASVLCRYGTGHSKMVPRPRICPHTVQIGKCSTNSAAKAAGKSGYNVHSGAAADATSPLPHSPLPGRHPQRPGRPSNAQSQGPCAVRAPTARSALARPVQPPSRRHIGGLIPAQQRRNSVQVVNLLPAAPSTRPTLLNVSALPFLLPARVPCICPCQPLLHRLVLIASIITHPAPEYMSAGNLSTYTPAPARTAVRSRRLCTISSPLLWQILATWIY
jgi:hypothetical protein